jgi:hypothetical protein
MGRGIWEGGEGGGGSAGRQVCVCEDAQSGGEVAGWMGRGGAGGKVRRCGHGSVGRWNGGEAAARRAAQVSLNAIGALEGDDR